ncbi:hypothetical protein EPD60_01245 [Flaviaesturariibacter flavus]|uniref:Uncharacterized protein n=1 Tax=Flaviaesturariibacter flavus TaxID=2502780 RepID=A0A4R1BNM4_9BACT|nr:hypothetical protein [Flaviaesturariibacter flavus]TCJ19071.1 hypothetical protein EPD60_01245 [Flaviaesturariibacter flavus]
MENLFSAIATLLFGRAATATPLTYRCCALGSTLRFHKAPFVHQSYNREGDEFFTGQSVEGPVTYGFVTCRLMKPLSDLMLAEQRLFLFMESLHEHFGITCTAGLDHGIPFPGDADAIGMTEYWQDEQGKDWKVAGWTDGTLLSVMYVRDISITDFRRQDAFLNSFRFAPARKFA